MKYTVIYSNYRTVGSHLISMVQYARIETKGDNFKTAIQRYGIEMSQVHFIFEGWPTIEGEREEDVRESA